VTRKRPNPKMEIGRGGMFTFMAAAHTPPLRLSTISGQRMNPYAEFEDCDLVRQLGCEVAPSGARPDMVGGQAGPSLAKNGCDPSPRAGRCLKVGHPRKTAEGQNVLENKGVMR
jgi:hypothetical protein